MVIFHSYVKLPEGTLKKVGNWCSLKTYMRDLSVNSWISWRSIYVAWRLPWHGKDEKSHKISRPLGGAAAAFPKCRKGLWQGERPTNAWWDEHGGFVVSLIQGTVLVWVESQQDWMNISADSADASVHQDLLGFFSDFLFFFQQFSQQISQTFPRHIPKQLPPIFQMFPASP